MPDLKPRLGSSLHSSPGMAPPSRSPLPHPTSPISGTIRPIYQGRTPGHPQHDRMNGMVSRSPSALGGAPLSPTSSGFASPVDSTGNGQSPPLLATEVIHQLQSSDGQIIRPDIHGKIDKGFFMADNDWTCYRRNYFSLNCSYSLLPAVPTGSIHLIQHGGATSQVYGFALSIAAVVDGRDGKAIELVQHTPKRDKGPQEKPGRITLAPRPPPPPMGMYSGDNSLGGNRSIYDQGFGPNPGQPATEATFERIQFKNATANNGKRRAAQQYYHLLVELFADVGSQHPDRYIKIATRMSAPMVVRGRSPGHYQSERRGSNASTGPGGAGGAGGAGSYTPGASASRAPGGDLTMTGTSRLSGNNYSSSYNGRTHHYRQSIVPPLQIPMEPTLSAEEAKCIEENPGYMYFPGAIYEGHESRYNLPSVSEYTTAKLKHEYSNCSSGQHALPSLASTQEFSGRCGRWEGVPESKGYFPNALVQQEMNIT
ncbi:NDT80/PhoG like DNA-binding family protein-like protein [Calycina marina]|uniref:NDT80/PhoG like DNA-binding family protein-like protein n=1 Tax=Calycina marina TaxID=1763456 RepID=A0A9P7Z1D3_9HELO|nr:NDT80/PhoG like DNA-binding family protein-like protein [Calycina marina]